MFVIEGEGFNVFVVLVVVVLVDVGVVMMLIGGIYVVYEKGVVVLVSYDVVKMVV